MCNVFMIAMLGVAPLASHATSKSPICETAAISTSGTVICDFESRPSLIRAGLSPQALAAAGVTSSSVADLVADVGATSEAQQDALGTADAALATARVAVTELERLCRSGTATEADVQALQAARTDLAAAEATVEGVLNALFTAGTEELVAASVATLSQIRSNSGRGDVPVDFRVVERSDAEWAELRRLLVHERVQTDRGEDLHPIAAAELATLRANPAVAAAKVNLDANLSSVEAAWMAATDQQ